MIAKFINSNSESGVRSYISDFFESFEISGFFGTVPTSLRKHLLGTRIRGIVNTIPLLELVEDSLTSIIATHPRIAPNKSHGPFDHSRTHHARGRARRNFGSKLAKELPTAIVMHYL